MYVNLGVSSNIPYLPAGQSLKCKNESERERERDHKYKKVNKIQEESSFFPISFIKPFYAHPCM